MKRKYFSVLLMGALSVATMSTVTSCKDYDDDISNLQQQIDANATAIKQIEDLIKGGGVIKTVSEATDGVTVTLSNGQSFNIKNGTNGVDGTPGTVWTIGEDGYWVKDGNKTDYKAVGQDGVTPTIGDNGNWFIGSKDTGVKAKGENGQNGKTPTVEIKDGYWYINGENTKVKATGENGSSTTTTSYEYYVPESDGYFWIYKNGEKVRKSNIKYVSEVPNAITASLDSKNLTLKGVKGISGETVVISLTGDLTGLVFMPNLYMDGIETLTYDWLNGKYLKVKTGLTGESRLTAQNNRPKTISGLEDYLPNRLGNKPTGDAYDGEFNYGPTWGVKYHLNPTNAEVVYKDVQGFNVLEPKINNFHTRATAEDLKVSSPEKDAAGNDIFSIANGILTAGLSIQNPNKLEPFPTIKDINTANTIALQVNTKNNQGTGTVTSDYALIQPQKAYVEALVWKNAPMYAGAETSGRKGDEVGVPTGNAFAATAADAAAKVHVWDSPQEALADPDGAALELYYNSDTGINIGSYLGIHAMKENVQKYNFDKENPAYGMELLPTWDIAEAAKWGLKFEFNLVNYKVDGNETVDSKYAKWVDKDKGILRAWNVNKDGELDDAESATSIDREPLVQVLVKRGDKVVLDGYILIHITRQNPEQAPNLSLDLKSGNAEFDLCNGADKLHSTWAEFSSIVLTNGLENMTKKDFDNQYSIDKAETNPVYGNDAAGNTTYRLKMFAEAPEKGSPVAEDAIGDVEYFGNTEGTTNHTFKWHLSAEDLEKLTHDKTTPVTISRYVRYVGNAAAKYPYIYIKLTYTLTRKGNVANTFGEIIPEYWKSLNGAANGKEAVIFDVKEPTNNGSISQIVRKVTSTLKGNEAKITGTHKYYFAPIAGVTVGGYTITPQKSASDTEYNKLYCKYLKNDSHAFDKDKLKDIMTKCAVVYADNKNANEKAGAFNNKELYAVKNGVYTKIADLDQETSEITLDKKEVTKEVLNALGFAPENANINKQLRAWVGVVAENSCNVAQYVNDGLFLASWERPINLISLDAKPVIDANTNGNCIYALDLFRLYDWRGWKSSETEANCEANQSNMWGNNLWFWGYYNVKSITIDTTPANVETTLGGGTWTTMDKISKDVELKCGNISGKKNDPKTAGKVTYENDLSTYNKVGKNAALTTFMKDNKAKFGTIWYYNNGGNVETFKVKVPVTVEYEWGKFTTKVEITINPTIGD